MGYFSTRVRVAVGLSIAMGLLPLMTGCGGPNAGAPPAAGKSEPAAAAKVPETGVVETPKATKAQGADNALAMAPNQTPDKDKSSAKQAAAPQPIVVPDGTPAQLLKFIDEIRKRPQQSETREAALAEAGEACRAIVKAADKILAAPNLDEQTRVAAVEQRFRAMFVLANLGEPGALEELRKYANVVAQDKDESLAALARPQIPRLLSASVASGNAAEGPQLLEELKNVLTKDKPGTAELQQALDYAESLAMVDPASLAVEAFGLIKSASDKVEDKDIADQLHEICDGAIRRLEFVGKPLDISGTTLTGMQIDSAKLKGKVFLVDFWATWCGPCVKEFPNIKENYTKYHDRGFEVIGVSLDDDREKVEQFVKHEDVPWPVLFLSDPQHPDAMETLSQKFGITTIPSTFLVGRDGKVVSVASHGPRLGMQLEQLLSDSK